MVLPLLLVLLLGIIEMGRCVRASVAVSNAARNGASYASATVASAGDEAAIRQAVLDEMAGFQTSDSNPVVTTQAQQDARGYNAVTLTVDYRFAPLMRFPGFPAQWRIVRSVQMRALS